MIFSYKSKYFLSNCKLKLFQESVQCDSPDCLGDIMHTKNVGPELKSLQVKNLRGRKRIFRADIEMFIYHALSRHAHQNRPAEDLEFIQSREHFIVLEDCLGEAEPGIEHPVRNFIL